MQRREAPFALLGKNKLPGKAEGLPMQTKTYVTNFACWRFWQSDSCEGLVPYHS